MIEQITKLQNEFDYDNLPEEAQIAQYKEDKATALFILMELGRENTNLKAQIAKQDELINKLLDKLEPVQND